MNILGISCFYHDSAAALLRDGELVAAAHEERFTRKRHDSAIPRHAVNYCLREAGLVDRRRRLPGLLRQAARQVRAHPDHLPRDLPALAAVLLQGDSALAEGEAVRAEVDRARARLRRAAAVRRASPEPRRLRVPALALRGGRDPHHRRRGRVGHRHAGRRARQQVRADQRDPLPALARSALQRLHLLPRLQGELRRVQGHGRGALRRAEVRRLRSSST